MWPFSKGYLHGIHLEVKSCLVSVLLISSLYLIFLRKINTVLQFLHSGYYYTQKYNCKINHVGWMLSNIADGNYSPIIIKHR